ncbi:DUF397 domain-containing protein [Actinacidiphila bryophytorum]|uniref:DUF397 domain-containing protein n=1 Tax=Actinacidiphila bryophytorum TaxID=1436133 RepID=UPI002176F056|nr:DUF397 domain-containing protein [Actinacidiphila bryophytorum]UWE12855.1 DUF397 domain-containing protein [Actinacidiphila bryophytorum]
MTSETPRWCKSSYSDNGGNCVEVATNLAPLHGIVAVRDSKDPIGPELSFPTDSFGAFIAGVKAGQFGTV